MRRARALAGQSSRSPLGAWPMTSPRTEFFCVSKVREQKVAVRRWASEATFRSILLTPRNNCTLLRVNGWESEGLMAYSPGRKRKKNAMLIISAVHLMKGHSAASATARMRRSTWTGTGLTLSGGGSSFE